MMKMKNVYCIKCNKYIKLKNPKTLCIFHEILILPIIFDKCNNDDEKIFKEQESIQILKILDLIE